VLHRLRLPVPVTSQHRIRLRQELTVTQDASTQTTGQYDRLLSTTTQTTDRYDRLLSTATQTIVSHTGRKVLVPFKTSNPSRPLVQDLKSHHYQLNHSPDSSEDELEGIRQFLKETNPVRSRSSSSSSNTIDLVSNSSNSTRSSSPDHSNRNQLINPKEFFAPIWTQMNRVGQLIDRLQEHNRDQGALLDSIRFPKKTTY